MFLTEYGYINEVGLGSSRSRLTWTDINCSGPTRLRWRKISDLPFDRFGRLDLMSKCALAAVEMLRLRTVHPNVTRRDMGISLGTQFGSFDVDVRFVRGKNGPGGGSPILFPYTLPSTAMGEIAIRHRITGPNICFLAGVESGLLALWEGIRLVESNEAAQCLCVGCEGISVSSDLLSAQRLWEKNELDCYAYAFLIEAEADAQECSRTPLARISIEHGSSTPGENLAEQNTSQTYAGLCKWLAETGISSRVLRVVAPRMLGAASTLVIHRI